jgi:hypothetical protein
MSVDDSRFAAAQRTAAKRRGSKGSRLKGWVVIVPTIVVFAATLVGGAAAFGKPDYGQAAKKLPSTGALVLVSADGGQSWLQRLTSSRNELCAVTPKQLTQVAAHYDVSYLTVTVGGRELKIAKVSGAGANDHEMRAYLGDPKLSCKFVREGGAFFLPFDPNLS